MADFIFFDSCQLFIEDGYATFSRFHSDWRYFYPLMVIPAERSWLLFDFPVIWQFKAVSYHFHVWPAIQTHNTIQSPDRDADWTCIPYSVQLAFDRIVVKIGYKGGSKQTDGCFDGASVLPTPWRVVLSKVFPQRQFISWKTEISLWTLNTVQGRCGFQHSSKNDRPGACFVARFSDFPSRSQENLKDFSKQSIQNTEINQWSGSVLFV